MKVQTLVTAILSHLHGICVGFKLHHAVAVGELQSVRFLVEMMHCNPMQRDLDGFAPLHVQHIEEMLTC